MDIEIISEVKILETGELYIILSSGGKSHYQHIYREAAEVYWDNELKGFKSPLPRKWSYSDWYFHIVKITNGCGIYLKLNNETKWINIPTDTKKSILAGVETEQ